MPHNYAGRVTLIIAVLFVGLFGIPGLSDGIFNIGRFFNPSVSFNEKLNLRPGIDIAGGTSLLYEIKPPPGGSRITQGTLAEDMAKLLKKRVDPNGVRNLLWRPQGDTRLEIQLPRSSMTKEGSNVVKAEYTRLKAELEGANVSYAQVVSVVENRSGDARVKDLNDLAHGNKVRQDLFKQLADDFDKMKSIEAQLADARKAEKKDEAKIGALSQQLAETRIAYTDAKGRIEQTNLSFDDLQSLVESTNANRNTELAALKARFPERKATIEKFEEVYPKYVATKSSIDDAADLKRLLRGSGVLEFHILAVPPGRTDGESSTISAEEYQAMVSRLQADGPSPQANDTTRWFEVDKPDEFHQASAINPRNGKRYALAWVTPDRSMVHREGGRDWVLQRAYPTPSSRGDLIVGFEFDDTGAALFSQLTAANIGKPLGTVLDNRIITAPNIRSQIGKSGTIDGGSKGYTEAERNYLVNTLNAGSLPAQLAEEPISERQVGPQLGEANLRSGMLACGLGLVVVAAFMIFYYHISGIVAFFAVVMNLVVILGVLGMMGATFTLPGIAGLVLTIGVSVDANVLIFERLREEEMRGLSLKLAVRNAYDRAFTAILDSNVTTAITSAFLIYFGSEEVKGFGLTLLIGILSSMFAALFVTKTIFGIMIDKYGLRKLGSFPLSYPAWNRIMHPNIDWMGKIKYFLAFSALFITIGLVALVQQGRQGKVLDVEFASGTEVQFKTKVPMTDGEVRERVAKKGEQIPQPAIVAVGNEVSKGKFDTFSVVTANADRKQVSEAITQVMKDVLTIDVRSDFANNKASLADAIKAGAIQPVTLTKGRFTINGQEVPDAPQNAGGVAIVLDKIEPPLTPEQISARVNRELLGSLSADTLQRIQVNRLDNNPSAQAPASSAVVLISNKNFDYAKSPGDWREKLAAPAWKVVTDGLGREASLEKVSNFDAQVAGDTQQAALFATLGSIVAIMVWIWLRFGDHKYGTATVLAMVHDTIMVVGAIGVAHWLADSFLGNALGVEAFRLNMTLVAAILTVMGYSMVDTIVVFDRIRENRGKYGSISRTLINDSINQTLSRTLLTAGTTLMTLFVMYVWGGPAIHGFTFVLLVGILIGTYSSIAIAAPILLIGAKQPAAGQKSPTKTTGPGAVSGVGAVQKIGS